MKRRVRSQKIVAEINITPLTDVILVLLLIFMVATPFIFQSSVKISLPKAKSMDQPPLEVTVSITSNGDAFLDKKQYSLRLDLDILKFKLSSLLKNKKDSTLLIRGDKNAPYDYVMRIVDLASQLGVEHVVLLTELQQQ